MLSREELDRRQQEMKERHLTEHKEIIIEHEMKEERRFCVSCKRRQARLNSPFCSRCSSSRMINNLRDSLPGTIKEQRSEEILSEGRPEEIPPGHFNSNPEVKNEYQDPSQNSSLLPIDKTDKVKSFTRSEASEIIGVSPTTLMRWERKGYIPQPKRIRHNNQCIYDDELIKAAMKFKEAEYHPEQAHDAVAEGTPSVLPRVVKKSIKLNRGLEKAVASRLGFGGRR